VLKEFERIAERGGVLGAMETGYQRGKIQDESMHYEMLKHTGEYPIIGVNTFRNPKGDPTPADARARALDRRREAVAAQSPGRLPEPACQGAAAALARLKQTVIENGNVFRRADGRGALLLAGSDHHGPVRGGRAVPAQHVGLSGSAGRAGREPGAPGEALTQPPRSGTPEASTVFSRPPRSRRGRGQSRGGP
jgi:hypothetical protein